MTFRKNLTSIILAGILVLNGAGCGKRDAEKRVSVEDLHSSKPYYATALDGSRMLVFPYKHGGNIFYRDVDLDGWADSIGGGYNRNGIFGRNNEYSLPNRTFRMEDLKQTSFSP